MHTFLIVTIVYSGLGFISASIPSSTIDSDLAEINKLSQDYKTFTPQIARKFAETTCQMISQCCPQIKSTFLSMAVSDDVQGLVDKCFGKKDSSNFLANILSCSPLMRMSMTVKNPQLTKYISITEKKSNQDTGNMKIMLDTCSGSELFSSACDWNKSDLQNTCQRKVLQKLAEQGDGIYKDEVQKTKDAYIKLVDELKKEFNN